MVPIVKILWQKPQREYQYFSQEFAFKDINQLENTEIELYEYIVTHKSWWDSVDFVANKLIGRYFLKYPQMIPEYIAKWLVSITEISTCRDSMSIITFAAGSPTSCRVF